VLGAIIAVSASLTAQAPGTDFGVRVLGVPYAPARATEAAVNAVMSGKINLSSAASLAQQWGRVTSTYRSPQHNRQVGGVRNSFHLSGRAIDIARRPGVSHHAIAAAYRNAGYQLVESLDEGDHSHFAFGFGGTRVSSLEPLARQPGEATHWKVVFAPR
jgi:hypothetical protein